jgi:hypothetical protein
MSHLTRLVRNFLPASLMLAALPVMSAYAADIAPEPVDTNSTVIWAGVAFEESEAWAAHAGGIWAANGDLDSSGFLFRGQVLYVDWEFDRDNDDDGDGQIARGNASIGYQFAGDGIVAAIFAGVDYQEVDVDPGGDTDLDDELGVIVTGRLATNGPTDLPMSLEGNYSTANDTYWARARIGYSFDWLAVGPEFAVLGDTGLDAYRVGGYAALNLSDGVILEVNGGYHDADGSANDHGSDDGAYGGATIVFVF